VTVNGKSKKVVRARMARTGESYMVAKRAIENGIPEPVQPEDLQVGSRMTDEEVLAEYGEHLGLPKA
jgi:hypothetical protein